MNKLFAICLLSILSPILLIVSLLVGVNMGRPILFSQDRVGKNNRIFNMLKFRTMELGKIDDDASKDAMRITRLGAFLRKTSLDELPGLFHIITGDMNFIGPRPLLVEYLPLYSAEQARRHEVSPGLTGWAQVSGRNLLDWDKRFKLDVWYVDNRTFLVDAKIIFLTFVKIFKADGINSTESSTMEKFKG